MLPCSNLHFRSHFPCTQIVKNTDEKGVMKSNISLCPNNSNVLHINDVKLTNASVQSGTRCQKIYTQHKPAFHFQSVTGTETEITTIMKYVCVDC